MRLHDLLDGSELAGVTATSPSGGTLQTRGDCSVEIRSVVHDDRDARPGALFCCFRGERRDGHDFAPAAVAAGAVACVVERWVDVGVPQVRVPSVREFVGPLAARFHGHPSKSMAVLGVTGTNGKTTTTYLLERIAREAGAVTGLVGTTGARLDGVDVPIARTTPEATDLQALLGRMRDHGVGVVAMEVSSHALDQHRVDGTRFAVACFTNLSHDHLDYHGTIERYFEAKARLFTPEFAAAAAVGVDTRYGRALADRARAGGIPVLTFAASGDARADVRAEHVELGAQRSSFVVRHEGERHPLTIPLVGAFNVANALAAFTTARLAGVAPDVALRGLAAPVVVPGRMEAVDVGQPFRVVVDYAHTPAALAAALAAARTLAAGGRVIVVFGCGGDRDRSKRPRMGEVVARASDVAFVTSDNPRSEAPAAIAREVLAGVPEGGVVPAVELDRRAAIRRALREARAGDVVVIAGKGHESGQTTGDVTVPFDDRLVAREELEARV